MPKENKCKANANKQKQKALMKTITMAHVTMESSREKSEERGENNKEIFVQTRN